MLRSGKATRDLDLRTLTPDIDLRSPGSAESSHSDAK